MILGETTAMRAFKSVEGMDKLGPAYLMARERAAEKQNTLRMGLMLVFIKKMGRNPVLLGRLYKKTCLKPTLSHKMC